MSTQFFLPSPSLHSSKLKTMLDPTAVCMFRSTSGRGFLGISGCAAEREWVGGFVVISEYAVGLWSQQSR